MVPHARHWSSRKLTCSSPYEGGSSFNLVAFSPEFNAKTGMVGWVLCCQRVSCLRSAERHYAVRLQAHVKIFCRETAHDCKNPLSLGTTIHKRRYRTRNCEDLRVLKGELDQVRAF